MSETIMNLHYKLGHELNEIKNYSTILPTEKELMFKNEMAEMKKKYEDERNKRLELESEV
jgi:hypothetical protein